MIRLCQTSFDRAKASWSPAATAASSARCASTIA
jgi:hypothetical protein